ncbi:MULTISPECIES: phosphotransferase family protein [unclassified Streptomyces]|uniref:Phosphotransferase family protein n=1 Tax=Streptomyces sp. NBC_00119 TaxID=2975659 RepID=A0AAU1UHF9_9ACTN|nr:MULTISPECIES: phosphotransferase family protein [unclassified Streptomyces]MCX4646769.1 phosphotransferase family protein [Streptomyces sp. NBC_01446]MCX5319399.1 phosphotransferase family protein [Streptomyces sp. NBC_00120]
MATAPRPRTSTRDPEEVARKLTSWLAVRLPGAKAVNVSVPESNGMSSETLLFDIEYPEPPVHACALRLAADPSAYTIFPDYDMPRQYRTMRLAAERTGLPVPRVLWLEEDPGPLGAPFFVMERVEGRVPPDVMPYTYEGNWLHSATDAERARLQDATVGLIARLHDGVPASEAEFLAAPGRGSALCRHVEAQRAYYAWVVDGLPTSPLIESAFDRLAELWPADEGEPVLNWGDARIGNIIYDGFEPAAVLDWEMAALAPREVDLGWTVYLHRFFQDLTESFGQAGLPGFLRRADIERRYAQLTGHTPRDMDFHTLYAALRHAIVMLRVAYRQVYFKEVAVPDDPDTLILHHASLRAMVQGSYWS